MTGALQDIEDRRDELRDLVARYKANRLECMNLSYGETSLRIEFLDPLFRILGWDVNNEAGVSMYAREVIHAASVIVDDEDAAHANKKPDYAFRIGGETKFFLEAKKPRVNILERHEPAFQVRRYGWNGSHSIAVLSNFEDLVIYDCGYRPIDDQDAGFARIAHYHYDELVDHFEEIAALISKESVEGGSLEDIDARERAVRVPFDDMFLGQITSWRADIALDIYERYGAVDDDELNRFTQTLINRIIFLRVCEDRSFEDEEELLGIASYEELRRLFACADEKYDSGLFDYLDDAPWQISDYLLVGIFQDLYYPNSPYDFNVVQPHVIGQIYERFLGERILVQDGCVRFEATPEAIESNGIVPTPKEITDAIVSNALQGIEFPCKVADICCGSGNFLLSVYECLVSKELLRIELEKDESVGLVERRSGYDLPFWRKRQIMAEAIYGVDIDPLAVEVAQLSLALRLLEGCAAGELDSYRMVTGNKLLPDLSNNIKCGNSLVGYSYFDYDGSAATDLNILRNVRPFNWDEEFPFNGFDAIVGNPPYIRVQNLAKYIPREYDFYNSNQCDLDMARSQSLDKYQLFVERALGLLSHNGRLGMIVPNKFMTIDTGRPLRGLLTGKFHVSRIVDFGSIQVFPGRSTYTCILVATPESVLEFSRQQVSTLADFVSDPLYGGRSYDSAELTSDAWGFPPEAIGEHLAAIRPRCSPLSSIANVFVGLQTSNDAAYIIEPLREVDDAYEFENFGGEISLVEKALCRPCLLDVAFDLYGTPTPNRQIIFPYEFDGVGRATLIPASRIEAEYPCAYEYLSSIKDKLDERAVSPKRKGDDWHKFGRSQSLTKFSGRPHIIWPVLSLGPKYVVDYSGFVMFTGGGNGPYYGLEMKDGISESIEYIQAVLGYWFTEALVSCKTSLFRGDYYSHGKQFVAALPVRRIDFSSQAETTLHDSITVDVRKINGLMARRDLAKNKTDIELFDRSIAVLTLSLETKLDDLYDMEPGLKEAMHQ